MCADWPSDGLDGNSGSAGGEDGVSAARAGDGPSPCERKRRGETATSWHSRSLRPWKRPARITITICACSVPGIREAFQAYRDLLWRVFREALPWHWIQAALVLHLHGERVPVEDLQRILDTGRRDLLFDGLELLGKGMLPRDAELALCLRYWSWRCSRIDGGRGPWRP